MSNRITKNFQSIRHDVKNQRLRVESRTSYRRHNRNPSLHLKTSDHAACLTARKHVIGDKYWYPKTSFDN